LPGQGQQVRVGGGEPPYAVLQPVEIVVFGAFQAASPMLGEHKIGATPPRVSERRNPTNNIPLFISVNHSRPTERHAIAFGTRGSKPAPGNFAAGCNCRSGGHSFTRGPTERASTLEN
jgi:hypothetical protein